MAADENLCASCRIKKPSNTCALCAARVCKKCVQFLDEEYFRYLKPLPEKLQHTNYCGPCFVTTVAPAQAEYDALMERARNMVVFLKKKGEETRLLNRSAKPIRVEDCSDEEDTLLRLALIAAKENYNVILDVELFSTIVRHTGGYQTMRWRGSAVPSKVDPEWLKRTENRQ